MGNISGIVADSDIIRISIRFILSDINENVIELGK